MTDPRALVALTKRLEETLAAIAALPEERKGSAVDGIVAAAAKRRDELAARRAGREAGTSAS
jgi:hypothetical protein